MSVQVLDGEMMLQLPEKLVELRNDRQVRIACLSTAVFWLLAHAYRFLNSNFSHDSWMIDQSVDAVKEIGLGRFFEPVVVFLRGGVTAPFLIGFLSLFWLAISACLLVKMLELEKAPSIVLACAVVSVNTTVSLVNATYLPWADIYSLTLCVVLAGIWLCKNRKMGFLEGGLLIAVSLALYQAYLQTAIAVIFVLVLKGLTDGLPKKEMFLFSTKAFLMLLIGAVIYYLTLQVVLCLSGIQLSNEYNGIADVGNYSDMPIVGLLADTWIYPVKYYANPTAVHPRAAGLINIILLLAMCASIAVVFISRQLGKSRAVVVIALIALFPFAMNIVYFISKGMEHELMTYSFCVPYLLVLVYADAVLGELEKLKRRNISISLTALSFGLVAVVVFNWVVFANQAYLKKDLEQQATLSYMTRLLDRIEQVEGYVPGQTPVAFAGQFNMADALGDRSGFEALNGATGLWFSSSVTHPVSLKRYFEFELGSDIEIVDLPNSEDGRKTISAMTVFPENGSESWVDGVLVVRISSKGLA